MKECEWVMNLKWFRVKFCEFWLSLREIENLGMRVFDKNSISGGEL
jgi:hypothetical protein